MSLWTKLKYLLPSYRRAAERDMQEELKALQEMTEPQELGNMTLAAESARGVLTWTWFENLGQDLRFALRSMIHNKAFTTLAVLSLALGIGANTAIYSFMDSILLRPLPVPHPETLVVMKWRTPKGFTSASFKGMSWSTDGSHADDKGYVGTSFPYPALKLFQNNHEILSSAFCYFGISRLSVTIAEDTEAVKGQYVSGDYFRGMSISPTAGRFIESDDDVAGSAQVAVLSHRFSQRRFGEAGRAVGQTIRINDQPFKVVGIAPPEFFGAEPGAIPEVYVPMHANLVLQQAMMASTAQQYLDPNFYWIEIMGRLKPGVSVVQAQAALEPQFRQFTEETTSTEQQRSNPPGLTVEQGGAGLDSLRRKYAKPVYVLMTMVAMILLIACANIANLLLARAVARRREVAIRLSIGAGRMRIIRQLLTESVLLSSIGGLLGVAFAWWGIRVLTLLLANGRENFTLHAALNWRVLGVTLALSLLTGLLFGMAPAIQATRADVMPALKEVRTSSWRTSAHRASRRLGISHVLVVAQVAFSLLLLVAAGLFGRTLSNLHSIRLGFSREDVLLFSISPRAAGYQESAINPFYLDLQTRLSQVAGVRSVSLSSGPLPSGGGTMAPVTISGVKTPDAPATGGRLPNHAVLFTVGPDFFDTMQIPRISGREFTEGDTAGPPVAIINERLARVFGLQDPVGQTMSLGAGSMGSATKTYEIVGLVRDALAFNLKDPYQPVVYFPYSQGRAIGGMTYEIRSMGDPRAYSSTVRQIVRQIDSRLAVFDMKTQAEHIDQAISSEITLARLCSVFAGLALVIACVGLYGTVAFNVERRTGEIGIRMALGARSRRILWMVLREILFLVIAGLVIGIPVVLAGSRYVKSFLYGIAPNDPVALAIAVLVMLSAGLLAAYIPARRASRIDPMVAVRHD